MSELAVVECKNVSKSFKDKKALDNVSFRLEGNKIYALLGRNGAGKTTLLNCLCTKFIPDSGFINLLGEEAYENENVLKEICFMSDHMQGFESRKVKKVLKYAKTFYERWNDSLMEKLIEFFEIYTEKFYSDLSKGQQTEVSIIIGLCSGCKIVLLDEIYSGLDAVARKNFYEILLDEQEKNPRTFILSTHLIEEMSGLFTDVIIIDNGKIVLCEDMDIVHRKAYKCVGRSDDKELLAEKNIVAANKLGTVTEYIVYDELDGEEIDTLREKGFNISSAALQELFIAFTENVKKEWGE